MSRKCNGERREKNFLRSFPTEAFTRTRIEERDNKLEIGTRNGAKVIAFREEETKKIIHIFVGATLPGSVEISEKERSFKFLFHFPETREFGTIIQGNTENRFAFQRDKNRFLNFVLMKRRDLVRTKEAGLAVNESNDSPLSFSAADGIPFPIANSGTLDNRIRPIANEAIRVNGVVIGISGLNTLTSPA